MTTNSLPAIYAFTLVGEEGHQTAPLAGDPGDATNYGITIDTLSNWLGRPAEPAEVYALSLSEAEAILRAWYFRGMGAQSCPAGVDLMIVDHAFNTGVPNTKRLVADIQRTLDVEPDSIAGPVTTAAAGGAVGMLDLLRHAQEADYRSKADFPQFGAEWIGDPAADTEWKRAGRLGRRYAAALELAGETPE